MPDYEAYTLEDFLADEYFLSSLSHPTAETEQFWLDWARRAPANVAVWQEACQLVQRFQQGQPQYISRKLSDRQVRALWARIEQTAAIPQPFGFSNVRRSYSGRIGWWAASAAVVLLVGLGTYLGWNNRVKFIVIQTTYGQTRTVHLPDGSSVMLNRNTTLRYPAHWPDGADRQTYLTGEAFFRVTHQKNEARFLVHTDHLDVEVLGTKFNVNTRHQLTRVTLKEGRVTVKSHSQNTPPLTMKPGETVEWLAQRRQLARRVAPAERYAAWTQKRFVFDETPLPEVAQLLEDNFGLRVQIKNSALRTKTISGEIALDNEEMLLRALRDLYGLDIVRDGQTVVLR